MIDDEKAIRCFYTVFNLDARHFHDRPSHLGLSCVKKLDKKSGPSSVSYRLHLCMLDNKMSSDFRNYFGCSTLTPYYLLQNLILMGEGFAQVCCRNCFFENTFYSHQI